MRKLGCTLNCDCCGPRCCSFRRLNSYRKDLSHPLDQPSFSFLAGLRFPPADRWGDDLVFSTPVFHDDFHRSIQQLHQMVEELKRRTRPAHAA